MPVTAQDESLLKIRYILYNSYIPVEAFEERMKKVAEVLSSVRQEAHAEGRREGLKEMDEALTGGIGGSPLVTDEEIASMRKEYSNQP